MPYPRKRFGQHFLSDQAIIHRIVGALNPKKQDHLVEIGPGQGAITVPVLKEVQYLEAIEIDRDLVQEIEHRTKHAGVVQVYLADVLDFNFADIKKDDRLLRIFGNLPYNISTPLLFHLLKFSSIISDMLFMMQKEVAERMAANENSNHYGRLSVMVQYHYQVEILFDVPSSAFFPPPQVQSSIIKLIPHSRANRVKDYELFESIVRHAFGQRRKTLRNSLKELIPDDVWANIPIHSDLRPENLSLQNFIDLTNAVSER